MTDFPDTRESLLVRVRDPRDLEAWEQFAQIYRPVIHRIAVKRGLQDADAQDLAQQVLMAVAGAIPRWERSSEAARFRHWLGRVTKNAILNALRRRPPDRAAGGSSAACLLDEWPEPDAAVEELITIEYRRELFLRAADIVRADVHEDTWAAFEMTMSAGLSVEAAARQLNKSVGTVYAARSRVMRRLRELINEFEESS